MPKKTEREAAIDFIVDRLEDSQRYQIQRKDQTGILLVERKDQAIHPKTIDVVLANALNPVQKFKDRYGSNVVRQVYTVPVFYRDGKTAFARVVDRNSSWRVDKSFKRYPIDKIHDMLDLRKMELVVLTTFGDHLLYYQPETARLPQSIRDMHLERVWLDYSHLDSADPKARHAVSGWSKKYKLMTDETRIIVEPAIVSIRESERNYRGHLIAAPIKRVPRAEPSGQLVLNF